MIPADHALDVEDHAEALVGLRLEERQGGIADHGRAVVLHADRLADRKDLGVVLHDPAGADEFDTAEFVVRFTALDQARHLRVTAKIQDLLALGEGPEHDLAIDDLVPHRDHVRMARRPDRGDIEHLALGQVRMHLVVGHRDVVALADHDRRP